MTTTIRSSANGSKSYIAVGGTDRVTIDAATGAVGIGCEPPYDIRLVSYGETTDSTKYTFVARDSAGNNLLLVRNDGAILATRPVGLGYGPGAGGTVTQATSKSTAVTLNKPCGVITMSAAGLTLSESVSFVLNNSLISLYDSLVVDLVAGASKYSNYRVQSTCAAGAAEITLTNTTPGTLSEAVQIGFKLLKGAIS